MATIHFVPVDRPSCAILNLRDGSIFDAGESQAMVLWRVLYEHAQDSLDAEELNDLTPQVKASGLPVPMTPTDERQMGQLVAKAARQSRP